MYKGKYYLREVSVIRGSCRNCDVKNLSKVGNKLHGRCKRSKILIEVIFPDGTTFDEYNLTATCPNTGEVFQIKKITEVDERHRFWRWERRRVYIIDGGVYTMETMVPMGTPCQGCSFLIGDDCNLRMTKRSQDADAERIWKRYVDRRWYFHKLLYETSMGMSSL